MDPTPEQNEEEERDEDLKDEQKGLLIILGSLVVISTIVIIGIFIFFPFNSSVGPAIVIEKSTPVSTSPAPSGLEENEYLSGLGQTTDATAKSSTENPAKSGTEEFFLEILPEQAKAEPAKPATVTTPITSSAPAPSANLFDSVANAPAPEKKVQAVVSKPETKAPAPAKSVAKAVEKPKAPVAPAKPKGPSFWVQVGSYSDEKLANNVIEKLKQEGFEAQKVKFNDGNRTLNRVRMGPFETKGDANKFLVWVQESADFKESYILQSNN